MLKYFGKSINTVCACAKNIAGVIDTAANVLCHPPQGHQGVANRSFTSSIFLCNSAIVLLVLVGMM